jgi:hypothetical protein
VRPAPAKPLPGPRSEGPFVVTPRPKAEAQSYPCWLRKENFGPPSSVSSPTKPTKMRAESPWGLTAANEKPTFANAAGRVPSGTQS